MILLWFLARQWNIEITVLIHFSLPRGMRSMPSRTRGLMWFGPTSGAAQGKEETNINVDAIKPVMGRWEAEAWRELHVSERNSFKIRVYLQWVCRNSCQALRNGGILVVAPALTDRYVHTGCAVIHHWPRSALNMWGSVKSMKSMKLLTLITLFRIHSGSVL